MIKLVESEDTGYILSFLLSEPSHGESVTGLGYAVIRSIAAATEQRNEHALAGEAGTKNER